MSFDNDLPIRNSENAGFTELKSRIVDGVGGSNELAVDTNGTARFGLYDPAGNPIGSLFEDASNSYSINSNLRGLGKRQSVLNSSTTPLGADAEFVGSAEDVSSYADVSLFIQSDVSSAVDGLVVEFSADGGLTWGAPPDTFTYNVGGTYIFTFGAPAAHMRVRYKNGSVAQSFFLLRVLLHPVRIKPSSHRISDPIDLENDVELVKAVISGIDVVDDVGRNVGVSGGRLLVSTETPPAPPGQVNVNVTESDGVAGISDNIFLIPSGKKVIVRTLTGGAQGSNVGSEITVFHDPNGNGIGMEILERINANGATFQLNIGREFVGDGVASIRLRRNNLSGGTVSIYARWTGVRDI